MAGECSIHLFAQGVFGYTRDCRLVRGHIALVINGGKPVKETRQVNAARVANHQPFVANRAAIGFDGGIAAVRDAQVLHT